MPEFAQESRKDQHSPLNSSFRIKRENLHSSSGLSLSRSLNLQRHNEEADQPSSADNEPAQLKENPDPLSSYFTNRCLGCDFDRISLYPSPRAKPENSYAPLAIQAKLKVGPAGDKYEQEADQVAEQVMRMPVPARQELQASDGNSVQRQDPEEEEVQIKPLASSIMRLVQRAAEEEEEVQTRRLDPLGSFQMSAGLEQRLEASRGGGSSLPADLQAYMELRFGADFSDVRIHTGADAAAMSCQIQAQAFTHGQDIYLGAGHYNPGAIASKRLLAHELTHTIQQIGNGRANLQRVPLDAVATGTTHLHASDSSNKVDKSKEGRRGHELKVGDQITADPDKSDESDKWMGAERDFGANVKLNFIRKEKVGFLPQNSELKGAIETIVDKASYLHPRDYQNKILEEIYLGPKIRQNNKVKIAKPFMSDPKWWMAQTTDDHHRGYIRHAKVTRGGMMEDSKKLSVMMDPSSTLIKDPSSTSMIYGGIFKSDQTIFSDDTFTTPLLYILGSLYYPFVGYKDTICNIWRTKANAYLVEYDIGSGSRILGWVPQLAVDKSFKTTREIAGAKYRQEAGLLFPKPPSKEDILQGGLGDCYLLAALISMVEASPQSIMNMMRDNRDGTVTVRLYAFSGSPPTRSYKKMHVKINKSTVVYDSSIPDVSARGADVYTKGALWVKLIEKAYVVAGFTGTEDTPINTEPSFGDIDEGFSDIAWEHLRGKPATPRDSVVTGSGMIGTGMSKKGFTHFPWSEEEITTYDSIKKDEQYATLVSFMILGKTDYVDQWIAFVKKNKSIDVLVKDWALNKSGKSKITPLGYQAEVRLEDFKGWFTKEGLNPDITDKIVQWLEDNHIYPGKRGTGKYTDTQLDFFQKIRHDLNAGKYIVLGSQRTVGREPIDMGHSANEPWLKGLVEGHAYAVMGYKPDKDTLAAHELAYITLRNPWGKYGRLYEKQPDGRLKVDMIKSEDMHYGPGEFDLELSDVTKRFGQIHVNEI